MTHQASVTRRIPGYCALCVSRCGCVSVVEDGRLVALEPDPSHPTGQALCAKGRAAPELVYHPERLLYPMRRTRPKGDPDPGWERITWDQALGAAATNLSRIASERGPESVAFSSASPSTSASDDSVAWIERLMNSFGSPNFCVSMELCGWGRYLAPLYMYGASVPGAYMPDLEHAGCILLWGYNPSVARLTHAVATADAVKRGARLIVVDPRRVGLAHKADIWLQVRPGTDAALALAITHTMIENEWCDLDFARNWTNAPLLVRSDDGRMLRRSDLESNGSDRSFIIWDRITRGPVAYDPAKPRLPVGVDAAMRGKYEVESPRGPIRCRPAWEYVIEECQRNRPEVAESICGVPRGQIEAAARMLWESRPVAYYAWSGVEQQTGATQIARAIGQLYALTGCFDSPGGNVLFGAVSAPDLSLRELAATQGMAPAVGQAERPLGPARWHFVTSASMYRAILEREPYAVKGLVNFGTNLLLSHADGLRGRDALAALDFYVHADLFMNPTAELADIVLPVASAFEREALRVGFDVSPEAQSLVQLRHPVVEPRGESRSDMEVVFELAVRLGLGEHFWGGDREAAFRHQLEPSGISLEELRSDPRGKRVAVTTRYRKFAELADTGPRGFNTPSRRIELYSETLLDGGHPPVAGFVEPLVSPKSRPDLAAHFPLILTTRKNGLFCESQHRGLPSLRRLSPDPEIEVHPTTAAARGIAGGQWVTIETPKGSVRARARLTDSLNPGVVCGEHGWWQGCHEIGAADYDPFSSAGANVNLIIGTDALDPISGSVPHRAYLCELRPLQDD